MGFVSVPLNFTQWFGALLGAAWDSEVLAGMVLASQLPVPKCVKLMSLCVISGVKSGPRANLVIAVVGDTSMHLR